MVSIGTAVFYRIVEEARQAGVRVQLDMNDGRVATVILTADQAGVLSSGTVDLYYQEETEVEITDIQIEGE